VAERAEEWRVFVTRTGQVLRVEHKLPEARAGATLDENSARTRAAASASGAAPMARSRRRRVASLT